MAVCPEVGKCDRVDLITSVDEGDELVGAFLVGAVGIAKYFDQQSLLEPYSVDKDGDQG